jgi:hypothetical protein
VAGSEETIMLNRNHSSGQRPDAWNKGRLTGQKRPLKPKDVRATGSGSSWSTELSTSPCSISPSIASSRDAISCGCKGRMSVPGSGSGIRVAGPRIPTRYFGKADQVPKKVEPIDFPRRAATLMPAATYTMAPPEMPFPSHLTRLRCPNPNASSGAGRL